MKANNNSVVANAVHEGYAKYLQQGSSNGQNNPTPAQKINHRESLRAQAIQEDLNIKHKKGHDRASILMNLCLHDINDDAGGLSGCRDILTDSSKRDLFKTELGQVWSYCLRWVWGTKLPANMEIANAVDQFVMDAWNDPNENLTWAQFQAGGAFTQSTLYPLVKFSTWARQFDGQCLPGPVKNPDLIHGELLLRTGSKGVFGHDMCAGAMSAFIHELAKSILPERMLEELEKEFPNVWALNCCPCSEEKKEEKSKNGRGLKPPDKEFFQRHATKVINLILNQNIVHILVLLGATVLAATKEELKVNKDDFMFKLGSRALSDLGTTKKATIISGGGVKTITDMGKGCCLDDYCFVF